MKYAAVLTFVLIAFQTPNAAKACEVKAQPAVSLPPVRFVRVKVQIQDGSGGELTLDGPAGHETSSLIQAGPVTTWVEWKNVALVEPGTYEVRLLGRCTARDVIRVAGGDGG